MNPSLTQIYCKKLCVKFPCDNHVSCMENNESSLGGSVCLDLWFYERVWSSWWARPVVSCKPCGVATQPHEWECPLKKCSWRAHGGRGGGGGYPSWSHTGDEEEETRRLSSAQKLGLLLIFVLLFYADDSGIGEGVGGVGEPPNISMNGKKAILLK